MRGKITPSSRKFLDSGGTVGEAHGSAEGVEAVDESDQQSLPGGEHLPGAEHELASEVADRVRSVIAAAEGAANAVRHEAEQGAQVRRRIAEEEATRIVEDAKRDAEAYLEERRRRISELSDTVVERAEKIVARLDRADEVRKQLQGLADALGETAEELAVELRQQPEPQAAVSEPAPAAEAAPVTEPPPPPPADAPVGVDEAVPAPPAAAEPPPPPEAESEVVELAEATGAPAPETAPPPPAEERREPDDQLSARLVALQMAVAGGNRGDVEGHLRQTFGIDDPSSILDDVFGPGSDSDKRVAWPRSGDSAA